VVTLGNGFDGLELDAPGGDRLRFPERKGTTFSGSGGTLVFEVRGGKVVKFTWERTVRATKKD